MSVGVRFALMMLGGAPVAAQAQAADPPVNAGAPAPLAAPVSTPPRPSAGTPGPGHATTGPDIVVQGRPPSPADPLESVNVKTYAIVQDVDKAVAGPVALAYKKALPSPLRAGLRNVLYNLREPDVFLNFLLQGKFGKAAETVGRFTVNSTLGVAGLLDTAKRKPFHLPRRRNGFAYTMGFYGIKSGPYLYLPFVGPTTVRDLIGDTMDRFLLPAAVGRPFNTYAYAVPAVSLSVVDGRAEFDDDLKAFRAQPDPYLARRQFYLRQRQAEIDHLKGLDTPLPAVPAIPPSSAADPAFAPATTPSAPPTTTPAVPPSEPKAMPPSPTVPR